MFIYIVCVISEYLKGVIVPYWLDEFFDNFFFSVLMKVSVLRLIRPRIQSPGDSLSYFCKKQKKKILPLGIPFFLWISNLNLSHRKNNEMTLATYTERTKTFLHSICNHDSFQEELKNKYFSVKFLPFSCRQILASHASGSKAKQSPGECQS